MNIPIGTTAALIANSKAIRGLKATITSFLAVLTILGVVTFAQFILEESSQTTMFSFWMAIDANQWDIVLEGVDLMAKINDTAKTVNKYLGWINPLSHISYKAFTDSTDIYIAATTARVFANDPSLFIGRRVNFKFTPQRVENLADNTVKLINRRMCVIAASRKNNMATIKVSGTLQEKDGRIEVDMTH